MLNSGDKTPLEKDFLKSKLTSTKKAMRLEPRHLLNGGPAVHRPMKSNVHLLRSRNQVFNYHTTHRLETKKNYFETDKVTGGDEIVSVKSIDVA